MNKRNATLWILIAVLIGAVAVLVTAWLVFRPAEALGAKTVTIAVVDDHAVETVYTVHTDTLYLREAMEQADGLTFVGQDGPYGVMVESVNGLHAVYEQDNAYWAFYLGDAYCQYGIDAQPVADGDIFRIVYTPADTWN